MISQIINYIDSEKGSLIQWNTLDVRVCLKMFSEIFKFVWSDLIAHFCRGIETFEPEKWIEFFNNSAENAIELHEMLHVERETSRNVA